MDTQREFDPTGKRRGSLRGSGTHDEFSEPAPAGLRDRIREQLASPPGAIEDVGAGATELEAELRAELASELAAQNRSRSPTHAPRGGPAP